MLGVVRQRGSSEKKVKMPWAKTLRGPVSAAAARQIGASQEWKCAQCAALLPAAFEIDHKTPLWKGGADSRENMWALCPNCHANKTQLEAIDRRLGKESAEKEEAYDNREDVVISPGKMRCSSCFTVRALGSPHPVCWAIEQKFEAEAAAATSQKLKRALARFVFR